MKSEGVYTTLIESQLASSNFLTELHEIEKPYHDTMELWKFCQRVFVSDKLEPSKIIQIT